jgi:HrpA-like RNA helicase
LRIQELYDVNQTPKIALGRVPVLVHILTPGMKPVQITQDLAGFWREHYPRHQIRVAAQISETPVAVKRTPVAKRSFKSKNFIPTWS